MITFSIDGVTIEPNGLFIEGTKKPRWIAYKDGISASNAVTPMLAYICYLQAVVQQDIDDLQQKVEDLGRSQAGVVSSLVKMMEVAA